MRRITHTTLLFLLLCGCKKDAPINSVDSDIKINMWETMDSTKRTLQFNCCTEKAYGCSNYGISKSFTKSGDNVDITFNGILMYDFCLTSIGPATTTVDLGALPNGSYNLSIKVAGKESTGKLIVASDNYTIQLNPQNQLQIINSPLHRVPINTIWGTVGYHKSSTATLVQTFIDTLQMLGATVQTYQSGDYGYFQIDSTGQILPPQNSGYYFTKPFVFNYANSSTTIKTLVKNYGISYGDSLDIILYTTKGEIFRSWIH